MTLGLLPEVSGASVLQAVSNNITAALAKYFAMLPGCLSGNILLSAFMFFDLGQKLARRDLY